MSTKAIIGIIIVIIIVVLVGVWIWKAPATSPAPANTTPVVTQDTGTTSSAANPATVASAPSTTTTTTTTTSATAPKSSAKVISTKTIDGMKIDVTKEGTGPAIANGQTAVMLYTGKLTDGSVFDSTASRNNQPFTFTLGAGQVIKGWDEGILGMKVGEERTLTIPPELGYGAAGYPPVIPQNATLVFDVTLVGIK